MSYGIKSPRCWSRRKGSFEPSRCCGKWFSALFTAKTPSSRKKKRHWGKPRRAGSGSSLILVSYGIKFSRATESNSRELRNQILESYGIKFSRATESNSCELWNQILVSYGIKSPTCWSRRKGSFEPSRCFCKWFLSFLPPRHQVRKKWIFLAGLPKTGQRVP